MLRKTVKLYEGMKRDTKVVKITTGELVMKNNNKQLGRKGSRLEMGWLGPYFVTDPKKQACYSNNH